MKQKEIKTLAKKVAALELQIQSATDETEKKNLENQMVILLGKAKSIQDMVAIDDMVQEILEKI